MRRRVLIDEAALRTEAVALIARYDCHGRSSAAPEPLARWRLDAEG